LYGCSVILSQRISGVEIHEETRAYAKRKPSAIVGMGGMGKTNHFAEFDDSGLKLLVW